MVGDELANELCDRHVPNGATILDPFCGSGRLLAVARRAAVRVGFDVNPLAWLLTSAKHAEADADVVADLAHRLEGALPDPTAVDLRGLDGRRVDWFQSETLIQLGRMVAWIDSLQLDEPELLVVATALSATVREVSYARQDRWKLHRIEERARTNFTPRPWQRLQRRLEWCSGELRRREAVHGKTKVVIGDFTTRPADVDVPKKYDVVLTSPPYGDSRTTVQYGAASALCLSVVSRLHGLGHLSRSGAAIDSICMGGRAETEVIPDLNFYWSGPPESLHGRMVGRFLFDYRKSCQAIADSLVPAGKAVFVVGCRTVGGLQLALDRYTVDCFHACGLNLAESVERPLTRKHVPHRVNRFARSRDQIQRSLGIVHTMDTETVLVLRK